MDSRVWEMALCVEKRLSMPTLRLKRHMSITSIMESIWLWMKNLFDSFVGHILAHKFYQLHNSSNIDFGSKLTIFFRYLCVLFDHRSPLLEILRVNTYDNRCLWIFIIDSLLLLYIVIACLLCTSLM
jgi:hypothetical protein